MCKFFVYIFFLWSLCSPLFSFSQDDDSLPDTLSSLQTSGMESSHDTAFDILTKQETISVRTVPQQQIDSLLKEDDFWYANTAPERKKQAMDERSGRGRSLFEKAWFRQLLWVVILCSFVAVVLWYLYSSNILVFRKAAKKIADEQEGEELTEDIFALPYEKEIARAVEAKNFRLAVRLWYLRTLKDLSDKGLIDYRYGRTNSDYVSQLYNTAYYRNFARLTRVFEYAWYGQFEPSADVYEMMQTDFLNFKKALG